MYIGSIDTWAQCLTCFQWQYFYNAHKNNALQQYILFSWTTVHTVTIQKKRNPFNSLKQHIPTTASKKVQTNSQPREHACNSNLIKIKQSELTCLPPPRGRLWWWRCTTPNATQHTRNIRPHFLASHYCTAHVSAPMFLHPSPHSHRPILIQ